MIGGSMRSKILLSIGLISGLLTLAVLMVVRQRVQVREDERIAQSLDNSLATFATFHRQREATLERSAALLAALPPLMALMTATDAATMQDGSKNFFAMSGGQLLVLAGRDGQLYAMHAAPVGLRGSDIEPALRASLASGKPRDWWLAGGRLFQVFLQPVRFGAGDDSPQIGVLALGFAVDEKLAADVGRVAGSQVAFCNEDRVLVSTLAAAAARDSCHQPLAGRASVQLAGELYRVASLELAPGPGASHVTMTVAQSYDQAKRFLDSLNVWIAAIGLAAILAGCLLAYMLSKSFTRPLGELVAGVKALEAGDFNYPLRPRGDDEVSTLTSAFAHMRGRLEESQRQLLASERLATIGRMATTISHDLRHPLTAILAYAEFLSEDRLTEAQRKDFFREVRIAVNRMTDELNSLLGFSKQGEAIRRRQARVDEIIERAIQNLRVLPEYESVAIRYEREGEQVAVFDPGKLERAVENLLFNACEAVQPISGSVDVSSRVQDGQIRVVVRDNGPGVDGSILPNLFQPFVSHGKEQGIGLGLTVVKKIAEDHGGRVELCETGPNGTVFAIEVPTPQGTAEAAADVVPSATCPNNRPS